MSLALAYSDFNSYTISSKFSLAANIRVVTPSAALNEYSYGRRRSTILISSSYALSSSVFFKASNA